MSKTIFNRVFIVVGVVLLALSYKGLARNASSFVLPNHLMVPSASMHAAKLDMFFLHLDNKLYVDVPNVEEDKIVVSIKGYGWKLTKVKRGVYTVFGKEWHKEVIVTVAIKEKEEMQRVVAKRVFVVRGVPDPRIKVGTCDGHRPVRKVVLKHQKVLHASLGPGWPFSNEKFKVKSYSITVQSAETGNLITEKVVGNDFTQVSHLVDSMPNGGFLNISDVVAVSQSFKRRPTGVGIQVH